METGSETTLHASNHRAQSLGNQHEQSDSFATNAKSPNYSTTGRKLRVWLNHSLLAPASPATFDTHSHLKDVLDMDELHFPNLSSVSEEVTNIDEALRNLSNHPMNEIPILDIKEDYASDSTDEDYPITKSLLLQLSKPPLDFEKDVKELEEEFKWKFGSSGSQEFQFASFGESDAPTAFQPNDEGLFNNDKVEDVEDEENNDGFGDFQDATGAMTIMTTTSTARASVYTPKSTDGVSTILETFQLDFSDFPSPKKDIADVAPATIGRAEKKERNNAAADKSQSDNDIQRHDTMIECKPIADLTDNLQTCLSENSKDQDCNTPIESDHDSITNSSPEEVCNLSLSENSTTTFSIPSVVTVVASIPLKEPSLPPSILSQTLEGRFLQKRYDSDQEESDDDPLILSANQDDQVLNVLKNLEWRWFSYWQWESLLSPLIEVVPSEDQEAIGYEVADWEQDEDEDGLEDWMLQQLHRQISPRQHNANQKTDVNTSEDTVPLFQNDLVHQLSSLDASHAKICKRLYERIQPHAEGIQYANSLALELDKNLKLCEMYMQRSTSSVSNARYGHSSGDGVEGAIRLLNAWQDNVAYASLDEILKGVQTVEKLESEYKWQVDQYRPITQDDEIVPEKRCEYILQLQKELKERLHQEPLSKLFCLQGLKDRCSKELLAKFQVRLHSCLEGIAVQCCSATVLENASYVETEYCTIIQALLRLSQVQNRNPKDVNSRSHIVSEICASLQTAWLMQTQRAFGLALLNLTDDTGESDYDQELLALSNFYDMNVTDGFWVMDSSKLAMWTNNLSIIRLDFEIQSHPLAPVVHKLCILLFQVLYGHYTLVELNFGTKDDSLYQTLGQELSLRRPFVWNACVQVLEQCLDEYLKHVEKKVLFQDLGANDDDWLEDLEGLHDVHGLIHQFLSLRNEFLQDSESAFKCRVNKGSLVQQKLDLIIQKHVKNFHAEAMNTMGMVLYQEDWSLVPLAKNLDSSYSNTQTLLQYLSLLLEDKRDERETSSCRSKHNLFCVLSENYFANCSSNGNPFAIDKKRIHNDIHPFVSNEKPDEDTVPTEILTLLSTYCDVTESFTTENLVPRCFNENFVVWLARLLLLVKKLPSVIDEAVEVVKNICDLYLTTCFRLCAGNGAQEQIIIGSTTPLIPDYLSESLFQVDDATSPMFAFGRRPSVQKIPRVNVTVPFSIIEAELCAPLPSEMEEYRKVQSYIAGARDRLKDTVKIDQVDTWIVDPTRAANEGSMEFVSKKIHVLKSRCAASSSCIFVGAILHLFKCKLTKNLSATDSCLNEYVGSLLSALPILLSSSNRISCTRAINGKAIVNQIVAAGSIWEEAKLHEHANPYVDSICELCSLLWCCLSASDSLPKVALKSVWETFISSCYMAMLNGFARVPFCSTEGRALMSMDLAAFSSGTKPLAIADRLTDKVKTVPPPKISLLHGMLYVDTYIKVFYFPPEDAYRWIEDNYTDYHCLHALALIIAASISSNSKSDSLSTMIREVKQLYDDFQ